MTDEYNHALHPTNLFTQWVSRFTATFLGAFFALVLFALMMRFYFEMTIGKAIGDMRGKTEINLKK